MATASPVPGPVGYLVNHPAGLAGVQGIGYDYVLGSGGLYVQSESAHLTARVTVAPSTVRGLAPVAEKLQLTHGPIPARLFALGLRWFQDAPDTERFFAVRWDGDGYRLVVPPQAGTATRLAYQPPAGVVAEFHSHGSSRAFFSATDDRDEQGFRIYGVVGRLDTPRPELRLRVGVYGHFAPVEWSQVFDGQKPGVRLMGEEPESTLDTNHNLIEDKEVKMPYYLDNEFLLDNPWITVVGCGGTGGFVAEGLCRLFQGREATIVLVDHDRVEPHNLLRQNFYTEDVGKFKSQALADRLARAYRRPVGYSVYAFREEDSRSDGGRYPGLPPYGNSLLIGCADNAAARRAMAESLPGDPRRWLIDAGNDTNWGQVLIGNVADREFGDERAFAGETCYLLPAPTVQRPDLLTAVSTRPPDVDCAAALDLTDQDPTINQMMASLVLQVVRRMAAGTCPFMGLYLDMEQGTVTPTYVTPEAVERLVRADSQPSR